MNGMQSRKGHSIEKSFPGCLGRMVNLFDLNTAVTGNKLLADKPHRDGYSISRSQSDVGRMLAPHFGDHIEDKLMTSNGKVNGTPMKMLIDQEMSKEMEPTHNPPNVVAKLMGLDTLPLQHPGSAAHGIRNRGYSQCGVKDSGMPLGCRHQVDGFCDKAMQCQIHQFPEQEGYKDVYEIWQQSPKTNCRREKSPQKSPQKGRQYETINEKKMALVRQKFMEAKRLATDEKLRQSKEFQDALEVLSSHKDLFVKFLREPNPLFSQHLYEFQSVPPSPETKCITVLRPSKMVHNDNFAGSGKKSEKHMKKPSQLGQSVVQDKNDMRYSTTVANQSVANQRVGEYVIQPTRIVVLKPSPGKTHDVKAVASPPCSSPRIVDGSFDEGLEDDEVQESRVAAREVTRLMGHRRDETLLSSVFSNGYTGDESSFNKSENEYAVGNLSDSEVMSPSSKLSWDGLNRFGSPYSSSSFSRASCSPESSVCREAKKRLSERWALMASNGNSHEQRHLRRSSSTLGEMLALTDTKKAIGYDDEVTNKEQEPRKSVPCLTSDLNKECGSGSPKNLLRSKSVPISSMVFGDRLNIELPDPETGKTDIPKELTKAKSMKSSFKGKVSSLFFSRNKKSSKEKYNTLESKDDSHFATAETPGSSVHHPGRISDNATRVNDNGLEECSSPVLRGSSGTSPHLTSMGFKQGIVACERLSFPKPMMPGNVSENLEQPSPVSVLERPFEEDDNTTQRSSGFVMSNHRDNMAPIKSNLIDKSPPIESIARTLSWEDTCSETASPYSFKASPVCEDSKEEEKKWLVFVQTLLSAAGLDGTVQSDSVFARWHSVDNPLDPSLRDKCAYVNDKELLQEAQRRQLRSSRKLVFDCVNAALVDITGYRLDWTTEAKPCGGGGDHNRFADEASQTLVECVWGRMKEWFSSEIKCVPGDGGEYSDSLVVERVVRKEVVGKGWVEHLRIELDNLGKEIEGKLLEELVEEAVVDLTGSL